MNLVSDINIQMYIIRYSLVCLNSLHVDKSKKWLLFACSLTGTTCTLTDPQLFFEWTLIESWPYLTMALLFSACSSLSSCLSAYFLPIEDETMKTQFSEISLNVENCSTKQLESISLFDEASRNQACFFLGGGC